MRSAKNGNLLTFTICKAAEESFGKLQRYFLRFKESLRLTSWKWMLPLAHPPPSSFEFPEMDLMLHLVDRYFENLNPILPILHRSSFNRSIQEGLHKVDGGFGAVVLMVCAIGCRCATDPRVVHEVAASSSCTAWKFFNQISIIRSRKVPFIMTSVYEAQLYPVCSFLRTSSIMVLLDGGRGSWRHFSLRVIPLPRVYGWL